MRDWQEKHTPIKRLIPWSELSEKQIARNNSRETLDSWGADTFLFRDAAQRRPEQPVTQSRLQDFWLELCGELERRLQALGEVGPDGQPIVLTNRDEDGNITSAIYDLHSLRVTLLTAFAEQGVPIEILIKVAGHCTAIMTIYYQKYTIAHVTDIMSQAELALARDEQKNWERHIKSKAYDELRSLVAFNDTAGIQMISEGTGASWIRSDIGICPVGGNRCHEGGEVIPGPGTALRRHGPVPGGQRNCVRCRFFITGPAFLIGLQAQVNYCSFKFQESSRRYAEAQRKCLAIDFERKRAFDRGEAFSRTAEWQMASSSLEQVAAEVDQLGLNWHATYNLFQQCRAILRARKDDADERGFALVVAGSKTDLDFVLELDERCEREFELLDAVCQSATFYESIDASVANLKRMRQFDAMLKKNGYEPVFVEMGEHDALLVGNELARFMFTQFSRADVHAVISGRKTLLSLGIAPYSEMFKIIGSAQPNITKLRNSTTVKQLPMTKKLDG